MNSSNLTQPSIRSNLNKPSKTVRLLKIRFIWSLCASAQLVVSIKLKVQQLLQDPNCLKFRASAGIYNLLNSRSTINERQCPSVFSSRCGSFERLTKSSTSIVLTSMIIAMKGLVNEQRQVRLSLVSFCTYMEHNSFFVDITRQCHFSQL